MMIDVVQGSPAWFAWRLGGLGSSDAAAIIDTHRKRPGALRDYKALLGEKLAPPSPDLRYPEHWRGRGITDAVAELVWRNGVPLRPCCVQHDEEPFLRATLCGRSDYGGIVAKCARHNIAEHQEVLDGKLPYESTAAVQHCLLASGASVCWYVSTCNRKRFAPEQRWAFVEVLEDGEYQAELLDAERAFWERVQRAKGGAVQGMELRTA